MIKSDVIIIAGGLGKRLREVVTDVPKPLAPVGGAPFLDILLRQLDRSGCINRAVLAIGYLGEQIVSTYQNRKDFGFGIEFSMEESPLGTGGAIIKALSHTDGTFILAMNGDSFVDIDYSRLLAFHNEHDGKMTMVLRNVSDANRYGLVELNDSHRIKGFSEKKSVTCGGLINAGVYVFDRDLFKESSENIRVSLEEDLIPKFLPYGVYGLISVGKFIDIGVPGTYQIAHSYLKES